MKRDELPWGIVKITAGAYKGRIGNYDNDSDDEKFAVVYFGSPFIGSGYFLISHRYLAPVSTSDLMARHDEITVIVTGKKKVVLSNVRIYCQSFHWLIMNFMTECYLLA